MKYKVLKGSYKRPTHDSTWPDLSRAQNRRDTLRRSYQGSGRKKHAVWIEETSDDEPMYRKPIKGPWVGYNSPGPCRVNGRRP